MAGQDNGDPPLRRGGAALPPVAWGAARSRPHAIELDVNQFAAGEGSLDLVRVFAGANGLRTWPQSRAIS